MDSDADSNRACVLVVEDNRTNRLTLVRGVEQQGHRVVVAGNGREALAVLHDEPVDTVLLDLEMPEMDGFEVLAAMQCEPALHDVPVVVISAVEDTDLIARAIELGALDVLPKPFDPVLLRARLRAGLQQRRLRSLEQAYLRQELALRQQEKLATLGRLSAGLAHELNNPAAAAIRTARRLEQLLVGESEHPMASDAGTSPGGAPSDAAELADREDQLEEVLGGHGIERPSSLAPDLARAGVTPEHLEARVGGLDDATAQATVRRWVAGIATRSAVQQVLTSVERIFEIVGALRSYSYLDRAPIQEVDVRRGLDDTLTMLHHKIPDSVVVNRDYAKDLPMIQAHGGQLNQLWTNLVDNAVHALGAAGQLTLRVRVDGDDLLVEVEDDGHGIPAELQGQVFDPFMTTKEPGGGVGLGLNIAHQIVTDGHSGRITVSSRPGCTRFSVWLPLHRMRE